MQELLVSFLKEGTRESFLALRSAHLATEGLNPCSSDLDPLNALFEQKKFQEIHDLIREHMLPNYFMSPGIHMMLGFVLDQLGNEDESKFEQIFGTRLLAGIKSTGEGTEGSPYLLTRASDVLDHLSAREQVLKQQNVHERNGRRLDCVETTCGEELWFDVTEVMDLIERNAPPSA